MSTKDASAPEQHPSVSDKTATATAAAASATAAGAVKTERKRAVGGERVGERSSGREVWKTMLRYSLQFGLKLQVPPSVGEEM